MKCVRCGEDTPRLTLEQRYCPRCEREVVVPRSYGVINGGNVRTDNPNPFVQRAAMNTAGSISR